jgi:hypothetical protein
MSLLCRGAITLFSSSHENDNHCNTVSATGAQDRGRADQERHGGRVKIAFVGKGGSGKTTALSGCPA